MHTIYILKLLEKNTYIISRDYQGKRVNLHIGPLTKIIRPLFLDIVESSFADHY